MHNTLYRQPTIVSCLVRTGQICRYCKVNISALLHSSRGGRWVRTQKNCEEVPDNSDRCPMLSLSESKSLRLGPTSLFSSQFATQIVWTIIDTFTLTICISSFTKILIPFWTSSFNEATLEGQKKLHFIKCKICRKLAPTWHKCEKKD